mgnify:CR=1 FL=1
MGRSCRASANLKVRQPLGTLYVKGASFEQAYQELCEDELNVKKVVFTEDARAFTTWQLKPQMRTLGPKYGKKLGAIRQFLAGLDGNKAMAELKSTGSLKFDADGEDIVLAEEDLLIESAQMPGFVSDSYYDTVVVLDTNLTPELIEEGFVREIISKIQTMRKEAGFEVMDHIHVYFGKNDKIMSLVNDNIDEIAREVLANGIAFDKMAGYTKEWNINGEKVGIGVEKDS